MSAFTRGGDGRGSKTGSRGSPEPSPSNPITAEEAVRVLRGVPPFSAVALHLLQVVSQEDVAFRKVADIVRADAHMSADIVRVANSALFAPRFPVTGVMHALAMMGMDRVKALVTTVALKNYISGARGTPALGRCWKHNLACALISEEIARKLGLDADFGYTAGLLHDIGRMAMICAWPKRYGAFLDAAEAWAPDFLQAERQEFGVDHARAGMVLLRDWKLPDVLVTVVQQHHATSPEGAADMSAVVQFSCLFADALDFHAAGRPPAEDAPLPWVFREALAGSLDDIRFRVAERINAVECCFVGST